MKNDDMDFQMLQEFLRACEFEEQFFDHLSDGDDYHVIYYPDPETDKFPTDKAISLMKAEATRSKTRILYQVVVGENSVIFDSDSLKIGILPRNSLVGFEC